MLEPRRRRAPERRRGRRAREDHAGRRWVQVRLPVLPNGTTGWVPRAALGGYGTVGPASTSTLRHLRATLYREGRRCSAPVGVGRPHADAARELLRAQQAHPLPQPDVRPGRLRHQRALAQATDWPAGGFVGIHGTDRPDLVPGRVSHGCIRFRNADVLALARRMPVGTPITIR